MSASSAWPDTTIGQEFDVMLGKMLDAERNRGDAKPFIGNRAVQWGRIDVSAVGSVPLTAHDQRRFRLRPGDLLVCEGGEVGRAAIWHGQLTECYYQKALHRLRSKSGYRPDVLLALLELWAGRGAFADFVTQTSIAHLPRERFIAMPLPLIPREEQRAIADALSNVNRMVAALERLIIKEEAIKVGLLQELLTGRTRLPGFEGKWEPVPVGDLLEFKNGLNKGRGYFGSGTPIVNFMDVLNGPMIRRKRVVGRVTVTRDEIKRFSAKQGDLFFTRTSESVDEIGTPAVLLDHIDDAVFSGFVLRGRPRSGDFDSTFLARVMGSREARRQVEATATYTTRALTNGRLLSRVEVALPSLSEQCAISGVLSDADNALVTLRARLEKANAIRQGMMQELLTGRTRLSVPGPAEATDEDDTAVQAA